MGGVKRTRRPRSAESELLKLAEQNAVMAEIGRIINSSLVISDVLSRVDIQIKKLISFDRLRVNLVDHENNLLTNVHASGIDIPGLGSGEQVPLPGTSASIALHAGRVIIVQGMDERELSLAYPGMAPGFRAGLRSFMVVPLISNDSVVGAIGLQSRQPNAFMDDDARIAEQVASQISGAIANAQSYAERTQAEAFQRRLTEENAAIGEIGRIISSSTDISEIYSQFGEVVSELLPLDRISVTLANVESGNAERAYAWGVGFTGFEPGNIYPLNGTMTAQVIQKQIPLVSGAKDVKESACHVDLTSLQQSVGILSRIAVPLWQKNEIFGILQIHSRELDIYQDSDVRLLSTIAGQISGAIANARLYTNVTNSEENLRNSEETLRAVLETAADGILTIASHGAIESINPAVELIFGYRAEELIGENVSKLMPTPYHGAHDSYLSNYLTTGRSGIIGIDRELEGKRKDGSIFPMDLSVSEMAMADTGLSPGSCATSLSASRRTMSCGVWLP